MRFASLAALVVATGAAVAGCGGKASHTATTFTFDTRYERHRAESYATETVLEREQRSNEPSTSPERSIEAETGVKSTSCRLAAPAPLSTSIVCRIHVAVKELRPRSKGLHTNAWLVRVDVNPMTGALTARAVKQNAAT
jgi:hypothetical protein